jgi:hypothetical protein
VDGVLPTEHAWHETIEITHGFNSWFETGFYIFTSARNGNGWDWVGDHIRPRFRIPRAGIGRWTSAFQMSLAINGQFFGGHLDVEIRPIIDNTSAKNATTGGGTGRSILPLSDRSMDRQVARF